MGDDLRWILLTIGGVAIFGFYVWNTWIRGKRVERDPEYDDIELTVSPDDPHEHEMIDELSGLSQLVAEDAPAKERELEARKPAKPFIPGKSTEPDIEEQALPEGRAASAPPPEHQEAYTPVKVVDDPRPAEDVTPEEASSEPAPAPEPLPTESVLEPARREPPVQEPTFSATADEPATQADLFEDNQPIRQPVDGLYEWNESAVPSDDDTDMRIPGEADSRYQKGTKDEPQTQPTEEQVEDFFSLDEPEFAADPKPIVGGKKHNWKFWKKDKPEEKEEPSVPESDMPELILVIYVVAKPATVFVGEAIRQGLESAGLEVGQMNIFHRVPQGGDPNKPVFSVADMLEPGTLELDRLKDHTTPGLTFFMRLPGPIDCHSAFEDMMRSAEQVASFLGGEMRDERRSVLTKQTTEHMRERIQEYRRQTQLAASKTR